MRRVRFWFRASNWTGRKKENGFISLVTTTSGANTSTANARAGGSTDITTITSVLKAALWRITPTANTSGIGRMAGRKRKGIMSWVAGKENGSNMTKVDYHTCT